MYLKKISLKNFRKFSGTSHNSDLNMNFQPGLNVIVGENDSGKTAIIDAIKLLLGTVSDDYDRIQEEDFYCNSEGIFSSNFYIEGYFTDLSTDEAGLFLEWLSFDENGGYELRIVLEINKKKNDNGQEFIERLLLAGEKNCETRLDSKARTILKVTYLKPLRDADTELRPGFKSRLAQILKAHSSFKQDDTDKHILENIMEKANGQIENYFMQEYEDGRSIKSDIEGILSKFYDVKDNDKANTNFAVTPSNLKAILNKLSLNSDSINLGLGNMNLLFIATELILLENSTSINTVGPHITLIEELEAHLHTQAQIRLIKHLEEVVKNKETTQFILTSHSTNLVSSINPNNLIYLYDRIAHPLSTEYTLLDSGDYKFLERFLDSTKSNLFFAKGLILVEGDSELLLLPAISELIGIPLHQYGISLVNIGGTSFERYVKLFSTKAEPAIKLPISLITDLDVKPKVYYDEEDQKIYLINDENQKRIEDLIGKTIEVDIIGKEYSKIKNLQKSLKIKESHFKEELKTITEQGITVEKIEERITAKRQKIEEKYSKYNANIQVSISPEWTLEYCLLLSPLQKLLKESILETQYVTPFTPQTQSKIDKIDGNLKDANKKDVAIYELFKRLDNKSVSKAIVAQTLANKILDLPKEEKDILRENVIEDINIKYLIDAIIHASGKQNWEARNIE